jgi:hypothetical protein
MVAIVPSNIWHMGTCIYRSFDLATTTYSRSPSRTANVRFCKRRPPPGPGWRTVATTVSRYTSNPAHRSIDTSIPPHPFPSMAGAARREEPVDQETEVRARSSSLRCLRLPESHVSGSPGTDVGLILR